MIELDGSVYLYVHESEENLLVRVWVGIIECLSVGR